MMNTAATLVGPAPMQQAQQMPADPGQPEEACSDFNAVLAAAGTDEPDASADEPDAGTPDGMQSAAALAWLAGMLGADNRPVQPPAPASAAADDTGDTVPATAAQGADQSAPATAIMTMFSAAQISAPGAATTAVADAATSVASGIEAIGIAGKAKPLAVSPTRTPAARATADLTAETQSEIAVADIVPKSAATPAVSGESAARDERLIGALLERMSAHSGAAEVEQGFSTGPNLYADTRDAVASAAGQVSSLPEAVRTAVGSPRWANELGSRLVMMSMRGQQEGSLSLTPEHLGPLEVRISVTQDTTNIWFGAQHADTRAALTDALPRLREMFAASGLALGQAGVSHEMPRQEARRSELPAFGGARNAEPLETVPVAAMGRRVHAALLDTWA